MIHTNSNDEVKPLSFNRASNFVILLYKAATTQNFSWKKKVNIQKENLDFDKTAPTKFGFLAILHLCQIWR